MTQSSLVAVVLWFVLMAITVASLCALRNWAQTEFSTTDSKRQWNQWKDETARQAEGTGPVHRREAKSDEPPTLVLLRDYFFVAVTVVILLGTVMYVSLFAMIRGAARTKFAPHEDGKT